MDYIERLRKLDAHIKDHPNDYQAVISRMKTYSDAVEHKLYLRKIERIKKISEFRRELDEESK